MVSYNQKSRLNNNLIPVKKIVFVLITGLLVTGSCKKYPEGPAISFRTVDNRVMGQYTVNSFEINGIDCTDVYNAKCDCDFSFSYDRDTRNMSIRNCKPDGRGVGGGYDFSDDKKQLFIGLYCAMEFQDSLIHWDTPFTYFGPIGNKKFSEWTILKLKNDEMKITCYYEGSQYTIDMKKN